MLAVARAPVAVRDVNPTHVIGLLNELKRTLAYNPKLSYC